MLNGTLRLVGAPKRASWDDRIERLARALEESDAVVIGAGAGLSTSAGLTYTGERFQRWFGDFIDRYGFTDMYSGASIPSTASRSTGPTGAATSTATAM